MLTISMDEFKGVCTKAVEELNFDKSSLLLLSMFAALLLVELFDKESVEELEGGSQ